MLAGADVCSSFARSFSVVGCRRGDFCRTVSDVLSGGTGSGSCLAFLARKIGRGPSQEWCDKSCNPGSPTPYPSPATGEPHRIGPEGLGTGPVRFFSFVAGKNIHHRHSAASPQAVGGSIAYEQFPERELPRWGRRCSPAARPGLNQGGCPNRIKGRRAPPAPPSVRPQTQEGLQNS